MLTGLAAAATDPTSQALGEAGEDAVARFIGVARHAEPGRLTVPGTGPGGYRIPDFPPEATITIRGSVVKVKNVADIYATPPLRDLVAFAESQGIPLEIFTDAPAPTMGPMVAAWIRFYRSVSIGFVASWRDSESQQAQDDLDGLLNKALPFAQEMLGKRGAFYPYGMAVALDGATRMIAGDPGHSEHPASTDVIATMLEGLTRSRDELRAIAIVADVRTSDSDAVRVELEHRDGHAIVVLLPYNKKRFGRGIEYGSLAAAAGVRRVWASTNPTSPPRE